ncbi:MAG: alpha-galactosidase, partial [Acidobacteria bacterium]|nr:alpha-galactosidase [Acidobacteriota bacterium]
ELGADSKGVPAITKAVWTASGAVAFAVDGSGDGLRDWVSANLAAGAESGPVQWVVTEDEVFHRATAGKLLSGGIRLKWIIELARESALFRARVEMKNESASPRPVEWFPGWVGNWCIPAGSGWFRSWDSLTFRQVERPWPAGASIALSSRLHSSEAKGSNPYWVVGGGANRLYFGLEWCGGWEASLAGGGRSLRFRVWLPPSETQLTLTPGESIAGPAVIVVPVAQAEEALARQVYMAARAGLARKLHGGPAPSYPLSYNHWYAMGFHINGPLLRQQLDTVAPYGFDAFIIDAGWYENVGSWTPDPAKFAPGEFENEMREIKSRGIVPGIWTCPQFVHLEPGETRPEVDQPGFYEKFIQGHLIDLADSSWTRRLLDHVARLRARYSAGWWKYDQLLFVPQTRAGVMKNVTAFQRALEAVRKANPDLVIENCQSGGRMINELTLLADQQQWLRDGGKSGLPHARANIEEALGAIEFVFPWSALRWTNNPNLVDPADSELLRYYCRSAMAGSWGISADLTRIPDSQQAVTLAEIGNYRRLTALRRDSLLYDVAAPRPQADLARVTFFDARAKKAAVLVYRWDRQGEFDARVPLTHLAPEARYRVQDVDSAGAVSRAGEELTRDGLPVHFTPGRMSALIFIEAE